MAVGLHARDILIHVHGPGIFLRIVSVAQCLAEAGKFLLHVIGNASVENRKGRLACYGIIGNDNLKRPRAHARAFNGVCRDFALRLKLHVANGDCRLLRRNARQIRLRCRVVGPQQAFAIVDRNRLKTAKLTGGIEV